MVPAVSSGAANDSTISGRKMMQQNTTFRNSTGMTALSESEIFLNTSYTPSSAADRKANRIHIVLCD